MYVIPPIGRPAVSNAAGPDRGFNIGEMVRPMTTPIALAVGDLVEVDVATVQAGTGAWTHVRGLTVNAASTADTEVYGVALEAIAAAGTGRIGFIGDFGVKIGSAVTTPGLQLVANTTNDSTQGSGTASNYLISIATILTSYASNTTVSINPFGGRKVIGFLLSSNTGASGTGLVRLNGFGWGAAAL